MNNVKIVSKLTDKQIKIIENLTDKQKIIQKRLNTALDKSGLIFADVARHFRINRSPAGDWFKVRVPFGRLPELAKLLNSDLLWLTGENPKDSTIEPIKAYSIKPVIDESDLNDDEVMINVYNVSLSAGNGSAVPEFVETTHKRAFSLDWMRRKRLKHENLKLMKVSGPSMEPVLNDGDMILIDTSQTNIVDGKVYALVVGNDAKIKRLKRSFDGGIVIMSYNPHDDFKDVIITPDDMQYIHIIGLAVHKSGDI